MTSLIGRKLEEWHTLGDFARMLLAEFHRHGQSAWHQQIEMGGRGAVILVRGSPLPETTGGGYVAVFDDITQLIAAQRQSLPRGG
jgi:nitrogen fixation/metabolism regulation signal transduction histidine kinase